MSTRAERARELWADPAWRARTIAARNAAGRTHNANAVEKIKTALTGVPKGEATRERMRIARNAYVTANPAVASANARRGGRLHKGQGWSILARLRLSQKRLGKPSPALGHRHSAATRLLIGRKVADAKAASSLLGLRAKHRRRGQAQAA